ncbi:MAG: response regulator [Promethearchaeota archaeon]
MVKIFIVDDEESICETLTWLLEKEGHDITCTMTITRAKEIIKIENFDVYLIDLVLPGGDGIELIKLIRKLKKKGKIIVITGYPNIPTLVDSIRLDTYDYIKKPINQNDLKTILKQINSYNKTNQ